MIGNEICPIFKGGRIVLIAPHRITLFLSRKSGDAVKTCVSGTSAQFVGITFSEIPEKVIQKTEASSITIFALCYPGTA